MLSSLLSLNRSYAMFFAALAGLSWGEGFRLTGGDPIPIVEVNLPNPPEPMVYLFNDLIDVTGNAGIVTKLSGAPPIPSKWMLWPEGYPVILSKSSNFYHAGVTLGSLDSHPRGHPFVVWFESEAVPPPGRVSFYGFNQGTFRFGLPVDGKSMGLTVDCDSSNSTYFYVAVDPYFEVDSESFPSLLVRTPVFADPPFEFELRYIDDDSHTDFTHTSGDHAYFTWGAFVPGGPRIHVSDRFPEGRIECRVSRPGFEPFTTIHFSNGGGGGCSTTGYLLTSSTNLEPVREPTRELRVLFSKENVLARSRPIGRAALTVEANGDGISDCADLIYHMESR